MYSKHSSPGSRILEIIRNNDVTPSASHSRVFETITKTGGRVWRKKKKGLRTSFGKICKENDQRQIETGKFCHIVFHVPQTTQYLADSRCCFAGKHNDPNARAGLLFNSLNLLSGDILVVISLSSAIVDVVHYSENEIIVSLT